MAEKDKTSTEVIQEGVTDEKEDIVKLKGWAGKVHKAKKIAGTKKSFIKVKEGSDVFSPLHSPSHTDTPLINPAPCQPIKVHYPSETEQNITSIVTTTSDKTTSEITKSHSFSLARELAKVELERNKYKRQVENMGKQIEEYEEQLLQYRAQVISSTESSHVFQLLNERDKTITDLNYLIKERDTCTAQINKMKEIQEEKAIKDINALKEINEKLTEALCSKETELADIKKFMEEKKNIHDNPKLTEELTTTKLQLNAKQKSTEKLSGEMSAIKQKLEDTENSVMKLNDELCCTKQQLDSINSSRESLLISYQQEKGLADCLQREVEKLRIMNDRFKACNKILVAKAKAYDDLPFHVRQLHSSDSNVRPVHQWQSNDRPPIRRNDSQQMPYIQPSIQPNDRWKGVGKQVMGNTQSDEVANSDSLEHEFMHPVITQEEMARVFGHHNHEPHQKQRPRRQEYNTPRQLEAETEQRVHEEERRRLREEADKALRELDEARQGEKHILSTIKSPNLASRKSNIKDIEQSIEEIFLIQNIDKEIQKSAEPVYDQRTHPTTADDRVDKDINSSPESSIPSNSIPKLDSIDKEIQLMAQWVRDQSRRPSTAEVEAESDEESTLPYDPNLICPKCGKRYHIGGIQLFRRHVTELCPLLEK